MQDRSTVSRLLLSGCLHIGFPRGKEACLRSPASTRANFIAENQKCSAFKRWSWIIQRQERTFVQGRRLREVRQLPGRSRRGRRCAARGGSVFHLKRGVEAALRRKIGEGYLQPRFGYSALEVDRREHDPPIGRLPGNMRRRQARKPGQLIGPRGVQQDSEQLAGGGAVCRSRAAPLHIKRPALWIDERAHRDRLSGAVGASHLIFGKMTTKCSDARPRRSSWKRAAVGEPR